ncbi:MAG TPA: hypothetical protein VG942_13275 [Hyphomonadaceae bacterium]|nr:hypothetical protein [Hyphomonadaceae bacterium]
MAAALVAAACSSAPGASDSAAPKAEDIRSLRWLDKNADKVAFLTQLPPACETLAASPELARKRELGRIAFESPALLGGAAARMELSCASCHRNGRGNPDFFVEGVSDKPGAADVTSSIFSKVRGDGNFNPKPIPDIALRDGKQIKDRTGAEFHAKVHGLIVEEFDGQEPSAAVIDAVIAYLDGLAPSACVVGAANAPLNLATDVDAARAAYEAGETPGFDPATRVLYLRAARFRLERIYERLADPSLGNERRALLLLSDRIGAMAEAARTGRPEKGAQPDWARLKATLQAVEPKTLYDPGEIRAAFAHQ